MLFYCKHTILVGEIDVAFEARQPCLELSNVVFRDTIEYLFFHCKCNVDDT